MGVFMRIDAHCWRAHKRICISIDDDLFNAFVKFSKKPTDKILAAFRRKIIDSEFKNSNDAKVFIFSQMMKPSAFACFTSSLPDQVDLEDVC